MVNIINKPIWCIEKGRHTTLDEWGGEIKITIVDIDDFILVLGMDFFKAIEFILLPQLKSLLGIEDKTSFEDNVDKRGREKSKESLSFRNAIKGWSEPQTF